MLQLLAIFLTLLFLAFFYKLYWKPRKLHQAYVNYFKKQGYRVLEVPFRPFSLTFLEIYDYSQKSTDGLAIVKEKYPHYDIAIMNLMNGIFLDLINPDLIQEFFSPENFLNYHKSKMEKGSMERAIGEGIAFTEEKIWKMKKKVLNTTFNFDFIKSLAPKIAELCDRALQEFEEGSNQFQVTYDIHEYTSKLAGDVMLSCFFGQALTEEKLEGVSIPIFFSDIMGDINLQRGDPLYFMFGPRFLNLGIRKKDRDLNRRLKLYKSWGHKIVSERMEKIKKKVQNGEEEQTSHDLIEALTKNSMKQKNQGDFTYDYESIFNEFNTFFLAGFDTVSHYLVMMIYLIVQHPEVEAKVRDQIQFYMKDDDYSYDNLKQMKYIDCVEKEVTRFYGPANNVILRAAARNHYLKGVPIKKDTFFGVNYVGMHYSEEYYENPTQFLPDRWNTSSCRSVPSFAIGGFAGGPRSCIGKHLAKLQSKIGLIKFFKRYSRIELSVQKIEIVFRFLIQPRSFKSKMRKAENMTEQMEEYMREKKRESMEKYRRESKEEYMRDSMEEYMREQMSEDQF